MFNCKSDFITANGIRLHYYRTGGSKPPIVLAHGITDDGLCWSAVAEKLAGQWDVIMPDARGHGLSEAPADGYSLKNLAEDMAGLISNLQLEKPIIVGHSMGGITTLVLAALHPDLPKAIILEDPATFWRSDLPTLIQQEFRSSLLDWIESNKRKTQADFEIEYRTNNAKWSEAEMIPWINSKQRYSLKISPLATPSDLVELNLGELLKQVICPTVFISAEQSLGAIGGPEEIAQLKSMVPQLYVAHVAGAGHNIRREQFERYMEIIRQTLDGFQDDRSI